VFVRPGELRHAEWHEFDLDAALWVIPAGKMKMRKAHHVPLSRQSVGLFRDVLAVTGPAGYVFPSIRTRARPMSENTVNASLRRLGYASDEMTAHGSTMAARFPLLQPFLRAEPLSMVFSSPLNGPSRTCRGQSYG
jgi:integrase